MKTSNRKRHITLARNDNDRSAPAPAAARVADAELEWFFTMAESDMGSRSNYLHMVLPRMQRPDGEEEMIRWARARTAYRVILARLRLVEADGKGEGGVLQVAYSARPWPMEVRLAFGRAAGVAVRLRVAETWGMPDGDRQLDVLERAVAEGMRLTLTENGPLELEELRGRARARYAEAFRGYLRARRDASSAIGGLE